MSQKILILRKQKSGGGLNSRHDMLFEKEKEIDGFELIVFGADWRNTKKICARIFYFFLLLNFFFKSKKILFLDHKIWKKISLKKIIVS